MKGPFGIRWTVRVTGGFTGRERDMGISPLSCMNIIKFGKQIIRGNFWKGSPEGGAVCDGHFTYWKLDWEKEAIVFSRCWRVREDISRMPWKRYWKRSMRQSKIRLFMEQPSESVQFIIWITSLRIWNRMAAESSGRSISNLWWRFSSRGQKRFRIRSSDQG